MKHRRAKPVLEHFLLDPLPEVSESCEVALDLLALCDEPTEALGNASYSKTLSHTPTRGRTMPHEHIELAQTPNGEIGPRCNVCGIRLTFGEAEVFGKHYLCWEHYVEATGADTWRL